MPNSKPMLDERHYGSRARTLSLYDNPLLSLEEALQKRSEELNRPLTDAEKRQFYHGWRLGLYHYACNQIKSASEYLNADELDAYGNLLYGLARQLGMARTMNELDTLRKESVDARPDSDPR